MRKLEVLLAFLVQGRGVDGDLLLGGLRRLFLLGGRHIVAPLCALKLVDRGFAGLALVRPALGGDDEQHARGRQQEACHNNHRQQHALNDLGHPAHAGIGDGGNRSGAEGGIGRGLGRRGGRSGSGSGNGEGDLDFVAFKRQLALQRVLGRHGKAELARHGQRRVARKRPRFAGGNAGKGIDLRIAVGDHHIFGLHLAVVDDVHGEADQARLFKDLGAVRRGGHGKVKRILGRNGGHGQRLGHHRHLRPALVGGGHGKLVLRRDGNGDLFFQRKALAGLELLVGKDVAQRGIAHAQVAVIDAAGVFQLQGEGDGTVFHHALDVAAQLGRQGGFAVGDGLVFDGIGLRLAFGFGLVGDGGAAGEVLFAHGDGIADLGGLSGLQLGDGLLLFVNVLVFLDGDIREGHGAAVGNVIAHHHLLVLTGDGGADGAFDLDIRLCRLQGDLLADRLALVNGFAAVLVEGIFDIINHGPVFQRAFADVVGPRPGRALARLEHDRAVGSEVGDDLRGGVVEHDRVLHIGIAGVGDGDGDIDRTGTCQLVGVELHAAYDGVRLRRGGNPKKQHKRCNCQAQKKSLAFHHVISGGILRPSSLRQADGLLIRTRPWSFFPSGGPTIPYALEILWFFDDILLQKRPAVKRRGHFRACAPIKRGARPFSCRLRG